MQIARENKPDHLVIAGDLTEEKDRHPAQLVNMIVDHLTELAEIAPIVIVQGNHDYKEEGHAFFEFVRHIPRVKWVSKPTVMWPECLLLPHTHDYKRDWANVDLADYQMIVCHQTFTGSEIGFGRGIDGIPVDVIPKRSRAFCGDIHVPQELGKNIICMGAPYHVDFGDDYKSRIVFIADQPRSWLSVDTSMYPQKRAIHLELEDTCDQTQFNKGDILQIRVEVDSMDGWKKLQRTIAEYYSKKGAHVWSIAPKLMKAATRRRHRIADTSVSDGEIIDLFAKRQGLKKGLIATGKKLL